MTWETITIAIDDLDGELERIRGAGATVTHCTPQADSYVVTYCVGRRPA